MKGIMCFSCVLVIAASVWSVHLWGKVMAFNYESPAGEVCPENIKRAIYKMGPKYDYKMIGEKLYVNRGDGKWLRLRYERR